MLKVLCWFSLLLILLPCAIGTGLGYAHGWPTSWRKANWSSSGVLPPARASRDATVILLASRTGQWKSIFAEHMSIVVKPGGAEHWVRYDVVGWGNPVRKDAYAADAYWYGNAPRVIYRLDGPEAARLIPRIEASIARYPHGARGTYTVSVAGLFGGTLATEEGVELHLLGSTIGVDFNDLAIKLPALGKLGVLDVLRNRTL